MVPRPTACILVVGDEILAGHTQDTNSHWLANRLRRRGVGLVRIETMPDDVAAISGALRRTARDPAPTFCFVVGGIGPTPDDRTYEAVGRALRVPLEVRPELVAWARRRASQRGLGNAPWADPERAEPIRRMIRIPRGSDALLNPIGAAIGCVAALGGTHLVVLPGVPRELYAMFDRSFAPRWLQRIGRESIVEVEVRGAEARLWDAIDHVSRKFRSVRVGSYPQDDRGRVVLRITGPRASVHEARRTLARLARAALKDPED